MAQKIALQEKQVAAAQATPPCPANGFIEGDSGKGKGKERKVAMTLVNSSGPGEKGSLSNTVSSGKAEFSLEFENAGKLESVRIYRRPKAQAGAKSPERWKAVYSWNKKGSKQGPASTYSDSQDAGAYEYYLSVQSSKGSGKTKPIEVSFQKDSGYAYQMPDDKPSIPVKMSGLIVKQKRNQGFFSNFSPGGSASGVYYYDEMKLKKEDIKPGYHSLPHEIYINSVATRAGFELDVKDPDWFVESISIQLMRSVSWAKGTVSGIDPGALESDVSSTTTCITAGAKMNVRAFADRSSQFYGYASLDLGIATSDVEPGKKKFVYNFRGDLPVFPTHLLGDAMMSARLYVSLGDMAHRTVVDPNGEGFLGVALEFQPNSNMFIKPYLAQTSMNGIVGSKYSNTENQKLFQTNSSILGISFGYTTPNEKFSLVLNGSITFAKGFNRTEEGTTKNDAVSFSIKFIP